MWCNTQVSFSASPNNARSESELEVNPLNSLNLVGASKRFTNPATYDFTLAAYNSYVHGTPGEHAEELRPGGEAPEMQEDPEADEPTR